MSETAKAMTGKRCARCGRRLKNAHSVARSLGPKCFVESGGDIFVRDLDVPAQEWTRRDQALRAGGEIDLGVNWQYLTEGGFVCPLRVSLRYRDGAFEAYGYVTGPRGYDASLVSSVEVVFDRSSDIKEAYAAAVAAGPTCSAQVIRSRELAKRRWHKANMKVLKGVRS